MSETRTRKIPAPIVNPESKPYWDAVAEGKLLYGSCNACKKPHFFPRSICPFCGSDDTEWKEASGKGTIYSHTTMHRVAASYTLAYVTLAEGPRMVTNIVDCDPASLKVEKPVRLVFKPAKDGTQVPFWTPA